jgi:hypothetical protein
MVFFMRVFFDFSCCSLKTGLGKKKYVPGGFF